MVNSLSILDPLGNPKSSQGAAPLKSRQKQRDMEARSQEPEAGISNLDKLYLAVSKTLDNLLEVAGIVPPCGGINEIPAPGFWLLT
jgi:hypothetical protein